MANFFQKYKDLDSSIWAMIFTELIIFTVNSAFFTIANIFMTKQGLADPQIASYWSVRFGSTLFFAVPFGVFIKGKRLKPLFLFDSIIFSLAGLGLVYGIVNGIEILVYISFVFMGLSDSATRILSISYVLRNLKPKQHTVGISLNVATWSSSLITSGIMVGFLSWFNPIYFNEEKILIAISTLGFLAFFFALSMKNTEVIPESKETKSKFSMLHYNWKSIIIASIPTIIIATGAGLTIPFVNLFFFNSFGVQSNQFAIIMMAVAVLVSFSVLAVPNIKQRFGYRAITITQSLSVIALFGMATTDFFQHINGMVFLAIFCFVLRQPLMNLAGPMTSEMTMYYVGKESQELMASLTATIWSGSWFISSIIFRQLRALDFSYGGIFYITVVLYIIGVTAYHFLIKDFEKKQKLGLITIE